MYGEKIKKVWAQLSWECCGGGIEKGLKRLEGVEGGSVKLGVETSQIVYETEQVRAEDVKQKIESV
ncbi:heavy-metal-associated domain-containing protein, partial [Bacillus altitudinis]|uniref:heavy-metal-associated domain-containing protein n=1 Tax=Bacillus altitudinis TaxID=293387 RepID=UPI00235327F4